METKFSLSDCEIPTHSIARTKFSKNYYELTEPCGEIHVRASIQSVVMVIVVMEIELTVMRGIRETSLI